MLAKEKHLTEICEYEKDWEKSTRKRQRPVCLKYIKILYRLGALICSHHGMTHLSNLLNFF